MLDDLVIATGNPHKVEELSAMLSGAGVRAVGLADIPAARDMPEPAETGTTFRDNALIKARAYASATGRPCLADDSGLEVDALDGAPGVISAYYCTDGRDTGMPRDERDPANNRKLLAALDGVRDEQRAARFRCVIVVAAPDGSIIAESDGAFEGRIGAPPRVPAGDNGFGYDPLFLVAPDFRRTSAELPKDEKNALSHRAVACRALLGRL